MYTLKLYEAGVFSTNLGGPVCSLSAAIEQMRLLTQGLGAEPTDEVVGCRWMRFGTTPCCVIIVNDIGVPIMSAKEV